MTVEDVDASAAKAKELGGNVMMEPFDVLDVGRMAVIADPTGAVFCAVASRRGSIGAELRERPRRADWNELATNDAGSAQGVLRRAVRLADRGHGGRRR